MLILLFQPPPDMLKAAALPPGARWITVRPHGPGTEGQPVLIQPNPDGSARVIGGAGGKLNYLKLTGVRSEGEYKAEAARKAEARREEKKRQRERDKADGLTESKAAAREALRAQLKDHEAQFVQTVADAMGWKPEELRFPEEQFQNASPEAVKTAAAAHGRAVFQRAQQAVERQRQALLQGAAERAGEVGEIPMAAADPATISVQDLDPVTPATKGLGYSTEYGKRAEEAGLTREELAAEAEAARPADAKPRAGGEARKEVAAKVAKELEGIRDAGPKVDPNRVLQAKAAVELLKAEKQLRAVRAQAREKMQRIDAAREPVEPKAFVLEEVGRPVDAEVVEGLENDLRTLKTRAFLEELGKMGATEESVGRHIGVGGFNSMNAVALAVGGASMVDRSVVDVLGIAGAAQVLARRLHADLTPEEMKELADGMGGFHVEHYMRLSDSALREAREWHEMAQEIELGEAHNAASLAVAQELNARRREFIGNAQRTLGTALGEMEANAALVVALGQAKKEKIEVSLQRTPIEQAIQQARAIGLERGDYTVAKVGASTILTVTGAGMDRLARPVSREDLARVRGALDIMEGRQDEDDWLPLGVANRPDMAMNVKPGVARTLALPFTSTGDVARDIADFIGGRAADGMPAADIMAALLSEDTMQRAGDRQGFMEALEKIAPLRDADGKMVRAESYQDTFDRLADEFAERAYGGRLSPLHRQQFTVDQVAVDALHRALAEHPEGVVAFKPVGELTPQDQGALREVFAQEHGRTDPAAAGLVEELKKLEGAEPEKEVEDMFGRGTNPAWTEWRQRRDETAAKVNAATMNWGKYLDVMGSPARAYESMQDVVRSRVLGRFAEHHNRLRPGAPLKLGQTVIANDLRHLDALDPKAREARLADQRKLIDSLRERVQGRYAAGSVAEKMEAARAQEEAIAQAQMGLFGASEEPSPPPGSVEAEAEPAKPPPIGMRHTIGHAAERQIAGMMPIVGHNFRPGEPVKLWRPTMSGPYAGRQRAVKLIEHNGRTGLGMGVGSGKTSIMLSGLTNLIEKGKAKRGIFAVPSIVQGQFHGEALTLLEPGKYSWHCAPGASREERIAALKDPQHHFVVVTHAALRDDMLHLAAKREGAEPAAIAEKLEGMKPAERADYMKELMAAEGINADYLAVDEGHQLLNRQGKENSAMANVLDAVSAHMPYYVNATADPVKNDASEAFDVLAKMDPARYSDRGAFLRKYGVDTSAARDGLRRELARHYYTGSIDPGVKANKREVPVKLHPEQEAELKRLDDAAAAARMARMQGRVDVQAAKVLSPASFEGVEEGKHADIAAKIQASVGIVHNGAVHRAVNGRASTEALAKFAGERKGKPGVVFVHSLQRVEEAAERLKADGHRVVVLTGKDSAAEKDKKKRAFSKGEADIILCSDAGAVGANLQHGKWLVQYDTPLTAMVHAQRNGRIHRIGQTEDVELADLVPDHAAVRKARRRLTDKYELREIMTSPLEGLDDTGLAGYLHRVRAGQVEAKTPTFMPAAPAQVPEGLAAPDEQQSLF